MEDLVYIYTNSKLLWNWPGTNPTTWYEKNTLFEDSMSDVDESANESESLNKDPITLDELNKDEIEHDPFEFLNDDFFKIVVWSNSLISSKV